jgi:hypothetical protein
MELVTTDTLEDVYKTRLDLLIQEETYLTGTDQT